MAALTKEDCLAYLHEQVFRLQSKDYRQSYPAWPGAVGIEIEMLPLVPRGDALPLPVPLASRDGPNLERCLKRLSQKREGSAEYLRVDGQDLIAQINLSEGGKLTFEPGGQLEFSSRPYDCLGDAIRRTREVQADIDSSLAPCGIEITQLGINPWHTVDEIGLQSPKPRYLAMDEYYREIGPFGQRMMRQTCTIQVNLDFGADDQTLAKRYLCGMLIAPVATATFATSPFRDGQLVPHSSFRGEVWRHTDPSHTGMPGCARIAEKLDRESCVDTFLEAALAANLIFIQRGDDVQRPSRPMSFLDWMEDRDIREPPTLEDFKIHLSLMFPEARPRGFIELRAVDSLPRPFQFVPAHYFVGLMYDDQALDQALELLLPLSSKVDQYWREAPLGFAENHSLKELANRMMDISNRGLTRIAPCFLNSEEAECLSAFHSRFTNRGRAPADDLRTAIEASGSPALTLATLRSLETEWAL